MVKVSSIIETQDVRGTQKIGAGGRDMAMGQRQRHRQQTMWLATEQLPRTAGHVFYDQVNKTLAQHCFDEFAEKACQQFYA